MYTTSPLHLYMRKSEVWPCCARSAITARTSQALVDASLKARREPMVHPHPTNLRNDLHATQLPQMHTHVCTRSATYQANESVEQPSERRITSSLNAVLNAADLS